MISDYTYGNPPPKSVSQYKYDFCRSCKFYPCEILEKRVPIFETSETISGGVRIRVRAVSPKNDKRGEDATTAKSNRTINHETIPLSYDQEEFKTGCIMSCRHVHQVECGQKRVSEGIGEHFKIGISYDGAIRANIDGKWEPSQPVFISAQTGQGKNYFIENTLIPYVRDVLNYKSNTNQKVLILSNRLALK